MRGLEDASQMTLEFLPAHQTMPSVGMRASNMSLPSELRSVLFILLL